MADPRQRLLLLHRAALAAVEPGEAVRRAVRREGNALVVRGQRYALTGRVIVIGAGKAAAPMAAALEDILGDVLTRGVVVVKHGHGRSLARLTLYEAGHPVPDAAGLEAALAVETAIAGLRAEDLVLVCLSGGASALLPAPRPPLSLTDLQDLTQRLLASGADIHAVNAVRRRTSRLAGGGLARQAAPARVVTLALSDVIGNRPESIGSGPTVADPTALLPWSSLLPTGGWPDLPPATTGGAADQDWHLVGSNRQALDAAAATARGMGWPVVVLPEPLAGPAADRGRSLARQLSTLPNGTVLLGGGETTVVLAPGHGHGGRCQELALAAALELPPDAVLLAAGTDGTDGPTDAAGAVVDGGTCRRMALAGFHPVTQLARHDAYPALAAAGDLLITGPTCTNVMDVVIGMRGR